MTTAEKTHTDKQQVFLETLQVKPDVTFVPPRILLAMNAPKSALGIVEVLKDSSG